MPHSDVNGTDPDRFDAASTGSTRLAAGKCKMQMRSGGGPNFNNGHARHVVVSVLAQVAPDFERETGPAG